MTQVNMGSEVIETDLPEEAVADLQQPEAQPEIKEPETTENPEPTVKPESSVKPEPATEVVEPKQVLEPEQPNVSRKPKPIASLLEKKHELETQLEQERQAKAELEAKIQELSQQKPHTQNVEADDEVKSLAEEYGLDESLLTRIVNTARKGSELPQEVRQLMAERQEEKQQQEELRAFNQRVDSLAKTLPNEQFTDSKVRERLLELAYSTEKAPDGEPYFRKELSELYFAYIKPEVEPGQVSAESSQGGTKSGEILDFEVILNDDAKMEEFAKNAPSEQWQAFEKWRDEKQPEKIIRRKF